MIDAEKKIDFITFEEKIIVFIFLSFFIFIPLLLTTGIFWDDWTIYNSEPTVIQIMFNEAANPQAGIIHNIILSIENYFLVYRIGSVLFLLGSLFFIIKILDSLNITNKMFVFLIICMYISLPLYSAKIALINSLTYVYIFIFYLAFYLLKVYLDKSYFLLRIFSLIFFLVSFKLNSLLVYYLIVPFFILYKIHLEIKSVKSFFEKLVKYSDFIFLPILFWFIKLYYFVPYGDHINYNKISGTKIFNAFGKTFLETILIIKQLVVKLLENPLNFSILLLFTLIILFILKDRYLERIKSKELFIFFMLSFIMIFLGFFPYLSVGGHVDFNDWGSRSHNVAYLGFSILFTTSIFMFKQNRVRIFCLIFMLMSFSYLNISNSYNFQRDWYKQLSLIENFKDNKVIENNTSFLIEDKIKDWNVNNRRIRFYEYSGMFKEAFSDEKRFALPFDSYRIKYYKKRVLDKFFTKKFKLSEYKYVPFEYTIIIEENNGVNLLEIFELKYLEIFNHKNFLKRVKDITKIKVIKINDRK